ncbi:hypothetical protein Hanom_Chr09g00787801 [Helianthus anomalus]
MMDFRARSFLCSLSTISAKLGSIALSFDAFGCEGYIIDLDVFKLTAKTLKWSCKMSDSKP